MASVLLPPGRVYVKFPLCDSSGPHTEPAAFPGLHLSRQTMKGGCLTPQVRTDEDQFGICESHQDEQVNRRDLEEAMALA